MLPDKENKSYEGNLPVADYGNASNPSPNDESLQPESANQLFDKKAEKYLREVANIEDVPDAEEQQEAEEEMNKNNNDE